MLARALRGGCRALRRTPGAEAAEERVQRVLPGAGGERAAAAAATARAPACRALDSPLFRARRARRVHGGDGCGPLLEEARLLGWLRPAPRLGCAGEPQRVRAEGGGGSEAQRAGGVCTRQVRPGAGRGAGAGGGQLVPVGGALPASLLGALPAILPPSLLFAPSPFSFVSPPFLLLTSPSSEEV